MGLTASRLDVAGFPMLETLARSYTLLIPTFNRPDLLGRLLTYLEKQSAGFAVVVLDSSFPDNKAKNADVVSSVTLNIKRIEFDERISPFDKFRAGIEAIETQFVSLCADDDIVVTKPEIVPDGRIHMMVVNLAQLLRHHCSPTCPD